MLTHIARDADALVNLLVSAKTGIVRPMYLSPRAEDADIENGANRPPQELSEDLSAANDRFLATAEHLPDAAWQAMVKGRMGPSLPALSWLTGRGDGAGLTGEAPALPAWL